MSRGAVLLLPLAFGLGAEPVDADHDTFVTGADCDDADVHVHPHAPERANGVDDDCDGRVDDDVWTGLEPSRDRPRPRAPERPPLAVWGLRTGEGAVAYDGGEHALDGRIRGGVWTADGLRLDGGWVVVSASELELDAFVWTVRARTTDGGTLVARAGGGARGAPARGYRLAVADSVIAEVGGRRIEAAVDLRDGGWHEVELAVDVSAGASGRDDAAVATLSVDGVVVATGFAPAPVYDGSPTLFGAALERGVGVDLFRGELAEVRVDTPEPAPPE